MAETWSCECEITAQVCASVCVSNGNTIDGLHQLFTELGKRNIPGVVLQMIMVSHGQSRSRFSHSSFVGQ